MFWRIRWMGYGSLQVLCQHVSIKHLPIKIAKTLLCVVAISSFYGCCSGGRCKSDISYGGMRYTGACCSPFSGPCSGPCSGQCGVSGCQCETGESCGMPCDEPAGCGCPEESCTSTCGSEGVECGDRFGSTRGIGSIFSWCRNLGACSGCSGETYWSEWHNDPPGCEPCDCYGNWIGRSDNGCNTCLPLPDLAPSETPTLVDAEIEAVEEPGEWTTDEDFEYALESDTFYR